VSNDRLANPSESFGSTMLEHASLFLEQQSAGPTGIRRVIRDAKSLAVLGQACLATRRGGFAWNWFGPRDWVVSESTDESLLCIVRRAWRWSWEAEVIDADGNLVACLRPSRLLCAAGMVLAESTIMHARDGKIHFQAPGGATMAGCTQTPTGTLLEFASEVTEEPLVKMALLAAVLDR
jgi:hypothetical protein